MSTELLSASPVSRLMQNGQPSLPKGYYRSKLFIIPYSTNPLLAAASPLFSLLERLSISNKLPAINTIHDNIEHELQAFQSRLHSENYDQSLIAVAYYLMTSTLDEVLGKSYLRLYGSFAEFRAFTPLTQDETPPQQRFFEIVRFIKERPNQYLDLIELAYFCLIAGYEGEHHQRSDGRQTLDHLIEELYTIVQNYRVNKPHKLFDDPGLPKSLPKSYNKKLMALGLGIGLILLGFFASELLLEQKAKSVLQGHYQIPGLGD